MTYSSPGTSEPTTAPKTGILVSHTHWDRAWYLNFEQYRLRLIRLVDRLMVLLEEKPTFRSFTLDGQTILLEDYLEIKPQNREKLKELISEGRLEIGPWYMLPDLFLVSGESLYRNLQYGNRLCREFGGGLREGYVPDPFGHIAQMPQILNDFGIETYIFMRGWGEEEKEKLGGVFNWKSPGEQHSVLALYQREGYFNAGGLGYTAQIGRFDGKKPDVDLAVERIREALDFMEPLQKQYSDVYLFENGFDHMPEQPEIPELIEELNNRINDLKLKHGSIAEFAEAFRNSVDNKQLGDFAGDLLGNVDHPVLASVYSTRVYLKQANHRCQHLLERVAEPISVWAAIQSLPETNDRDWIDHAWKLLLKNHPHDDICGCSVDGVHEDNEVRYRQVAEGADTLLVEKLEGMVKTGFQNLSLESDPAYSEVFVFNPDPAPNSSYVETEVFFTYADGEHGKPVPLHHLRVLDAYGVETPVEVLETTAPAVRNHYIEITWGRFYHIRFKAEMDGFGYHLYRVCFEEQDENPLSETREHKDSGNFLDNDNYHIEVKGNSIEITDKQHGRIFSNAIRFEYQLDYGDTYSFGPAKEARPVFAELIHAEAGVKNDAMLLTHALTVPESKDSPKKATIHMDTEIALDADQISCTTCYRNTFKDGRLRIVLPDTGSDDQSWADSSFQIAQKEKPQLRTPEFHPKRYEAYPGELDYPTHYAQDFLVSGKPGDYTWVAQRGNHEYELLRRDDGNFIAITLHRSVGYLSVGGGRIRRCQAGPSIPTPGAQCLMELKHHIAFGFDTEFNSAVVKARQFAHPLWVRELPELPYVQSSEILARKQSLIEFSSPEIFLSTLKYAEHDDGFVLRMYNPQEHAVSTVVKPGWQFSSACETDGYETWQPERVLTVNGPSFELEFGPAEIKSVLIQ